MINKFVAEFFGTMIFTYIILATGNPLFIGLALMGIIFFIGKISGGHVNPAISVMMTIAGKLPTYDLIPYIVAQTIGAVVSLKLYKRV